jgi:hypothetical protein
MNATLENIERAAKQLNIRDRAALAHSLLKGLNESEGDEKYIETLWANESEERLDAYFDGDLDSVPIDGAVERVLDRIRK